MPSGEGVVARVIASVKALLPEDWQGRAGRRFRAGTQAVSEFAASNALRPEELLQEGVELGRRKLTGVASQEHAVAEKNYAEAARAFVESEDKKIETELKKRSLEIDLKRKDAEADKARAEASKAAAEAHLAVTSAVAARLDLLKKLEAEGMVLCRDQRGSLTLIPKKDRPIPPQAPMGQ